MQAEKHTEWGSLFTQCRDHDGQGLDLWNRSHIDLRLLVSSTPRCVCTEDGVKNTPVWVQGIKQQQHVFKWERKGL